MGNDGLFIKNFKNDAELTGEAKDVAKLAREARTSNDKTTASNNLWSELQRLKPEDLAKIQTIINKTETDISCKFVTKSDNSGKPSEIIFGPTFVGTVKNETPIAFKYKDGKGWQPESVKPGSVESSQLDNLALHQKVEDSGAKANIEQGIQNTASGIHKTASDINKSAGATETLLSNALDAFTKKKK